LLIADFLERRLRIEIADLAIAQTSIAFGAAFGVAFPL